MHARSITRRTAMRWLGGSALALGLTPGSSWGKPNERITKPIPGSGEKLPVIGMGTWQTFNVGQDPVLRKDRTQVLKAFFDEGGGMVDSSPMYGSSQQVLGYALEQLGMPKTLFAADKVWTDNGNATRRQINQSEAAWDIDKFDLMQVHNLVAWRAHLETLKAMKADGAMRYIGVTTSHGRRHEELEKVLRDEPVDFVQLTYNLTHRSVEQRLLPVAQDRGIAVIANRPFDGGRLVKSLQSNHKLPAWAQDIDAPHWPAFLLKFIVSHPAVTCAIPATTKVEHMRENKQAENGALPDPETRKRMIDYVEAL